MKLKVFVDRLSQPARAILIFCKMNGIEFEEVSLDITKREHMKPEFKAINPMGQVPAIVYGDFQLFESHAILIFLAGLFGVPDHWYPADIYQRAKTQCVLDWHHSNLRSGAAPYVYHSVLAPVFDAFSPVFGDTTNPQAAAQADKLLGASLSQIESLWLKGDGTFLHGAAQPSIADLSLVCELMQLQLVDEKDRERILGPHKKIMEWIENTKNATKPHFDEVSERLYQVKAMLQKQRTSG
ncbi:hypothetical protein UlMin_001834 [Ulmus minor]